MRGSLIQSHSKTIRNELSKWNVITRAACLNRHILASFPGSPHFSVVLVAARSVILKSREVRERGYTHPSISHRRWLAISLIHSFFLLSIE